MINPVEEVVGRIVTLARGVRTSALVFAALSGLGALLAAVALIRWDAAWAVVVLFVAVLLAPAFFLWRFRAAMVELIELPDRLKQATDTTKEVRRSMNDAKKSAQGTKGSLIGLARLARDLRGEVAELRATDAGQAIEGLRAVHPARLAAGAGAAGFAVGSFAFGLVLTIASFVLN